MKNALALLLALSTSCGSSTVYPSDAFRPWDMSGDYPVVKIVSSFYGIVLTGHLDKITEGADGQLDGKFYLGFSDAESGLTYQIVGDVEGGVDEQGEGTLILSSTNHYQPIVIEFKATSTRILGSAGGSGFLFDVMGAGRQGDTEWLKNLKG